MIAFGEVPASSVLPIFFSSYGKTNGESITLTGLAATDIEVYKGTSMTQRASDAGYTLLDTDGIDIDGLTGIHGFSIDLGDNTDAGFYAVGSFYTVVVSAVTIDSQTVNFIAATFRIKAAESVAGKPKVDVDAFGGSAGTFASGIPEVKVASLAANAITATSIAADAITAAKVADGTIDAATFAAGSINAAALAADAITAAKLHADVTTELQAGLATAAALATVDGIVDDILVDTAEIGAAGAGLTAINLPNQTMDIVGNITGNLSGSVGSVTGAVGSVTAGVTLAASAVQAIWDALTSALTTVGSIGKLLVDNINATISSRLASASYTAPPTVGQIADQVWEEAIADHSGTVGSTAEQLAAAGAAGDPWATALPGAYGAGTAGKIVGDNLNATVSSRASQVSVDDLPTNAELTTALGTADDAVLAQVALVKAQTDLIPASPAAVGSAMTLTSGERDSIAAALLDLANAIETGVTLRGSQRLMLAALAGKLSGAAGTTVTFRNAVADSKDRIVATVDASGNRTAITADQT